VVAEELYRRHPSSDEGRLTRLKHYIVSRRSCAAVGRQTDLGSRMLAHGAERGRDDAARLVGTPTVLAGLVEAAIGAIYLEHGWETARDAVITSFEERFAQAEQSGLDPKTELQETLQRRGRSVQYVVVSDTGPAHDRHFESVALVSGEEIGRGAGRSKKESEQEAAKAALVHLDAGRGK
jgi:ribonuclease-3